ncbi:hypothetical protein CC86DRAFT_125052 [Ophiobolus disseminans]|uniref:Uncharacterized protein n=1 Tax=Ophiobolus disseminans TaxID=1469910 RepID=A0A6A6ZIM2_9PLEO|nr:hypothetical protein CC86DRAFT_125052 [Ophiobolus disseminans]
MRSTLTTELAVRTCFGPQAAALACRRSGGLSRRDRPPPWSVWWTVSLCGSACLEAKSDCRVSRYGLAPESSVSATQRCRWARDGVGGGGTGSTMRDKRRWCGGSGLARLDGRDPAAHLEMQRVQQQASGGAV